MAKILAFNWKLNPQDKKLADQLFSVYEKQAKNRKNSRVIVCPPLEFLFGLSQYQSLAKSHHLDFGAQDCFWENLGPYTGTVSALNLKLSGIDYVILGHSERRLHLGETDAMVNKKTLNAVGSGLKPILCIGEGFKIHEKGEETAKKFLKKQLEVSLKNVSSLSVSQKNQLTITYEPIWTISNNSGNVADNPSDAAAMIKYLKEILAIRYSLLNIKVLYGGSVNSKNVAGFLSYNIIDGFLIGRASLDKEEIKKIIDETEKRG